MSINNLINRFNSAVEEVRVAADIAALDTLIFESDKIYITEDTNMMYRWDGNGQDATTNLVAINDSSIQVDQLSQSFIATEGQTTFVLPHGYRVGLVSVFINGLLLHASDYTAVNGTSVILSEAATQDDVISIQAFSSFEVANTYTIEQTDTLLDTKENAINKGIANGYAGLDTNGTVPVNQLPPSDPFEHYNQATEPTPTTSGATWYNTDTGTINKWVNNGTVDIWVDMTPKAADLSESFVATEGQTTFTMGNGYVVGRVNVFLNGILLDESAYTAVNSVDVILNVGATAGNTLYIQAFGEFDLTSYYSNAELDNGQLDHRYYTEAEVDAAIAGVDALPDQTSNTGKFLTTNGTAASWADVVSSEHYDQPTEPVGAGAGATWYISSTDTLYAYVYTGIIFEWITVNVKDSGDITYDNTVSGLTATSVEAAIDEVGARLDVVETGKAPLASPALTGTPTIGGESIEDYVSSRVTYNSTIGTDSDVTTTGANVIASLDITDGVITSHSTRALTASDIDAADSIHTHDYLPLTGGTITGDVTIDTVLNVRGAISLADSDTLSFGTEDDCVLHCDGAHMYMELNTGIGNFYIKDGISTRFTFDDNGDFTAAGNVTAYSDKRLKTNITLIDNALSKVCALGGYTFDRTDISATQTGVIAQEVQEVLPEAVIEDENGMLSVNYGSMVGILIESIKELKAEIEELKVK